MLLLLRFIMFTLYIALHYKNSFIELFQSEFLIAFLTAHETDFSWQTDNS